MARTLFLNSLERKFLLDVYHDRQIAPASRAQDTVRRRLRVAGLIYFKHKTWHLTPLGISTASQLNVVPVLRATE